MRSRKSLPVLSVSPPTQPLALASEPMIPQNYAHPGLSLMQVTAIVWAYRKHALIIAASILLATAVVAKLLHKTYTATATLMVNYPQQDPLLGGGQAQATPMGTYMATEIQLMQSPEVMLPVIDKLKLTSNKDYTAGYRGDGSNLREWVNHILVQDVDIEPGQAGSQLIYVTAAAREPYLAAAIANAISTIYLAEEQQRISGPASERAKRYAAELVELKNKVRLAQDQVTAFRQRTGVSDSPNGNNDIQTTLLASLEARLQEAQNARRLAEVSAATDPRFNTGAAVSATVQALKTQIDLETAQLAQLRATLGPRHPKVLELESQIAANRRNLAAEDQHLSAGAGATLAAARALEAKLQAAVVAQRKKVLGISQLQDEGTKYMLELESAQNVYKRALDGYDQIMFASDSHMANVSIVSRAVPPQLASKPNKIKLVILGAFAGLFFGVLGPLAYELLVNRRIRCRDDFERDFQVPVLMEFDTLPAAGSAA